MALALALDSTLVLTFLVLDLLVLLLLLLLLLLLWMMSLLSLLPWWMLHLDLLFGIVSLHLKIYHLHLTFEQMMMMMMMMMIEKIALFHNYDDGGDFGDDETISFLSLL